jgi:hypothetical protein
MVHWTSWHIHREPLGTSGLKEGAAGADKRSPYHGWSHGGTPQAGTSGKKEWGCSRLSYSGAVLHAPATRQQGIIITIIIIIIIIITVIIGTHASAMVKVLCYRPEGRGIRYPMR